MEPTSIGGAWTFAPAVHRDDRGHFLEWFRAEDLSALLGHAPDIAQANWSVSRRGVLRGERGLRPRDRDQRARDGYGWGRFSGLHRHPLHLGGG